MTKLQIGIIFTCLVLILNFSYVGIKFHVNHPKSGLFPIKNNSNENVEKEPSQISAKSTITNPEKTPEKSKSIIEYFIEKQGLDHTPKTHPDSKGKKHVKKAKKEKHENQGQHGRKNGHKKSSSKGNRSTL